MKELIQQMSTFELGLNVTITGIVLMFAMLILLVVILIIFGKVTQGIRSIADNKADESRKAVFEAFSDSSDVEPVDNTAPVYSNSTISDEVVAVISAAIANMYIGSKKKPVIKAINKSSGRRSAWANAGIADNTRVF